MSNSGHSEGWPSRKQKYTATMKLILAASASGKSHFAAANPDLKPAFVDGDAIVTRAIGWPTSRTWYKKGAQDRLYVHTQNFAALCAHAAEVDCVIAFNGGIYPRLNTHVVLVTLSEEELLRNFSTREWSDPKHARNPMADWLANTKALRDQAVGYSRLPGSSFREAASFADAYEMLASLPSVRRELVPTPKTRKVVK